MPKRYKIEFFEQKSLIFYYPANLSPKGSLKRVAFGSNIIEAKCESQPNGRSTISISTGLADKLQIPSFISSLNIFETSDYLILGPLVGIFSSGFTPFQIHPIGGRSSLFAKLLSVQSSVGVVPFLFGEQHIDWEHGIIDALFYYKGGWKSIKVPFPNVIYDRLPNRRSENHQKSRIVKEKLEKEYLIPWYNPGFFNKLDVYERLYSDIRAEKYLPETSAFSSFHQIEKMLSDYGQVYVKPINGSLGLGVHQVLYDREKNEYYCRYHDTKNHLYKFTSLEKLANRIFAHKQLDRMLVQQGIHLIRFERRPVDFRVHANKDNHGLWQVSAIAAKVAGVGSPTTHVKNGGEIKTIDEIFSDTTIKNKFKAKLETAALELAAAIEDTTDGIVGEIGFDFGIDTKGNVWLFEANSKPGRSIFSHPNLKESDILTRKLSLSFAIFLTEKVIKAPEDLFL